jgi:putative salt-induced outer membrane protein YdiY
MSLSTAGFAVGVSKKYQFASEGWRPLAQTIRIQGVTKGGSMLPMQRVAAVAAGLAIVFSHPAWGDQVRMKNGDLLTGKIVKKETDRVIFQTDYAGEIPLQWDQIANITSDQPVQIVLLDGTSVNGMLVDAEPGSARVASAKVKDEPQKEEVPVQELPEAIFDLASAKYLNPTPDLTGEGVRWSGNISAGASLSNGNSETKQLRFDAETIARALQERYTVGGHFNRSEDRGINTLFNSRAYGKIDHFFSKKWYAYANANFENDRFRDLRLRSQYGVGSGFQIFETPQRNLSLEGGLTYISEDYYDEEDDNYPGIRWATRYDQLLFDGKTKFFHEHEVLIGLNELKQTLVYSKTGFRFPLIFNFNASTQFNFNWDSSPAEGAEKEDSILMFTLGYGW